MIICVNIRDVINTDKQSKSRTNTENALIHSELSNKSSTEITLLVAVIREKPKIYELSLFTKSTISVLSL